MAGSVLFQNSDLAGAESIFRLAWQYDPPARSIMRHLFFSVLYQTQEQQLPLARLTALIDSLTALGAMDRQMQEQAYNAYLQAGDYPRAKALLLSYLKVQPTARAYTSLFYLESQSQDKQDFSLLDKAFRLSGTDYQFQNSLGTLMVIHSPAKAETIWLKARQNDPSAEAGKNLWNLYAQQKQTAKLKTLWAAYPYPAKKEQLAAILDEALTKRQFNSLLVLAANIRQTQDVQFRLSLAQAEWYLSDAGFEADYLWLSEQTLTPQDKQLLYLLAAVHYLLQRTDAPAQTAISRLNGKVALDELLMLYKAQGLNPEQANDLGMLTQLYDVFKSIVGKAPETVLPQPVRAYLTAAANQLIVSPAVALPDSLAFPCVKWFYDHQRSTYDTYTWLIQHYQSQKDTHNLLAVIQQALGEYPDDATLLNWLGYNYVLEGNRQEEAETLIRRALQLDPDNPFYLDSLAWLYFLKDDARQALDLMKVPLLMDKMPSEIAFHLARIYQALGEKEEAIRFCQRAVDINDDTDTVKQALDLLNRLQKE